MIVTNAWWFDSPLIFFDLVRTFVHLCVTHRVMSAVFQFLFGTLKLVSWCVELNQHGPRAKLPKYTLNVEFKDKGPFGTLKEPNTMHDQLYDYSSCSYSVNEQTEAQTCGADMRFISSSLV